MGNLISYLFGTFYDGEVIPNGEWPCPNDLCLYDNTPDMDTCDVCGTMRKIGYDDEKSD